MVSDLIWAPDFFGPQEMKMPQCLSFGAQISWGPKVRGPNDIKEHFSYSLKNDLKAASSTKCLAF